MEAIFSDKLAPAVGPYCHAQRCGNIIVTSGSIPEKKDGSFVYEIKEATKLTLQNLVYMVEAAGGTKESIARVDVYLADLDDFDAFNEAYSEFFGDHKPTRVCTQGGKLFGGLPLEASVIAFVED